MSNRLLIRFLAEQLVKEQSTSSQKQRDNVRTNEMD